MHEIPLITTIALALSAALFFGLIVRRLGLSPIVGYLIAGVLIGPYTPGVVGDAKIASQLAEIGVILLMFGVGLHFSLKDLLAVRSLAIPGALAQSTPTSRLGLAVAIGWSWRSGLILGIAVSVASTVVILRALLIGIGIVETAEDISRSVGSWCRTSSPCCVLVLCSPAGCRCGECANIGHYCCSSR
jgi:CPA2 family monovalent cation:H+ antiporter-2